jgi:hypothetical protein
LDEYKARFLILTEEHILRVYENRVLRIFGPKREEVQGILGKTAKCGAS